MAIKRPDTYEHNNPNLPIADSDFVKGGIRSAVQNLNDLYALTGKADQLKQHSTQIYVSGENKIYLLKDVNNVGNVSGWEEFNFAGGSNIVYTTGNQTVSGVKTFASRPTVNGTGVLLIGEGAGGGDYNYFTTSITLGNSYINLANSTSGITATLPSIASGRNYIVKNLNTGTLTVTGLNSIDGNVNLKLHKKESAHLLGVNNVGFTGWVSLNTNPGIS